MQRVCCYLIDETAVVPELEPLVTLTNQRRIWRLTQRLVDMSNVVEATPGMSNVTVILRNPESPVPDAIEHSQHWWEESEALELEPCFIEIPVVYGSIVGLDLVMVAAYYGSSERQAVELHSPVKYVVWFLGFQPGLPHLGSLLEQLHTSQYAEPRLHVPTGSAGIGGPQTGVYPLTAPDDRQLIGHTPLGLFDLECDEPILSRPGDSARFAPQKEGVY